MPMHKAALAVAMSLTVAGCGAVEQAPSNDQTTVENIDANELAAIATPAVPFGKTGSGEGFEITVLSVERRSSVGTAEARKAGPTETFVVIRYRLKNTMPRTMDSGERPEVVLLDGVGQANAADDASGLLFADDGLADAFTGINPNVSANRAAVFKVDKASFNKASWRLAVPSDGSLTFALQ